MKKRVLVGLALILPLLSAISCGVPQEEYNKLNSNLAVAQTQIQSLQNDLSAKKYELSMKESELVTAQAQISSLEDDLSAKERELATAQRQIAQLRSDTSLLKDQYELVGETAIETAENIVKRYYETHIYSEYDFFVCSDMSLDVWNMLKAQGIDALIKIGNVETGAKDITEVNHAWVLAETSPGHYLALETTGGYTVWGEDNPLYYRGWSFDNPREYKRFVELKQEYNIRTELAKQMWETFEATRQTMLGVGAEYTKLANQIEGMSMLDPSLEVKLAELVLTSKEFGELVGRCEQLTDLINERTQELENIASEMRGLTG